jgi:hypothetical protein
MNNIRKAIRKIIKEQKDKGALEEKISEAFETNFTQFSLKSGSIKIEKMDSIKDRITGSLSYTINQMAIYSDFIYIVKDELLVLGNE